MTVEELRALAKSMGYNILPMSKPLYTEEERIARKKASTRKSYEKRKDNPEYRAKMREYKHTYYLRHKEQITESNNLRRKNNPEWVKEHSKKWRKTAYEKMKREALGA